VHHARGAFNVAEPLLQLGVGGLEAQPLGILICSRSSIIWRSIWAAIRWRSSGLSCSPVVRMANNTLWDRSKSVTASSLTRATTRSPSADARAGDSTMTMARRVRRNSADIEPAS